MLQDQHFVLFAKNIGNVGRPGTRQESSDLQRLWNQRFATTGAGLRIEKSFRHTGNFLVVSQLPLDLKTATQKLLTIAGPNFALFCLNDFLQMICQLRNLSIHPPSMASHNRRPTLGAVMALDPDSMIPPIPESSDRILFSDLAFPRLRAVWKLDLLTSDGRRLDPTKREGGWGAVATEMAKFAGGSWTARAFSTLTGLANMTPTVSFGNG